ncbi:MAG: sigma-E factor negative regulatory protein [Gammaproteobacteria bacterium]|nr:sigma-E factor negative regulatory protein [Gammaproteobacteria bacterium]
MTDTNNELLSVLMDGELTDDFRQVLQQFKTDSHLRSKWAHYHLIRDTLKQRHLPQATTLSERVTNALADEPVLLAPFVRRHVTKQTRRLVGWSVAASVLLAAVVWVGQQTISGTNDDTSQELVAFNQEGQVTPEVEQTLSDYIVNHNEYSASARMQGMLPYTRLVSYTASQDHTSNRVE